MNDKHGVISISLFILVATLAGCGGGGAGSTTAGADGDSATPGSGGSGSSATTAAGGDSVNGSSSSAKSSGDADSAKSSGDADIATTGLLSRMAPPAEIAAPPSAPAPPQPVTVSPPAYTAPPQTGSVDFAATFPNYGQFTNSNSDGMSNDGMWWVEQKSWGRASVVWGGRDGDTALRLHTDAGDNNVSGSGNFERNDVALQYANAGQGQEQWWAHSILFPDDFAAPPWELPTARAVVFDFHDTRNQGGQANFHIVVEPGGHIMFRANGGPYVVGDGGNEYSYGAEVGWLQRNTWYDFVYHVKWSAYGDGYFVAWVNGEKKLEHYGPTLYEGYGVYLKLANYHTGMGQNSSVIHDRVIRGTSWQAVSLSGLQGISW